MKYVSSLSFLSENGQKKPLLRVENECAAVQFFIPSTATDGGQEPSALEECMGATEVSFAHPEISHTSLSSFASGGTFGTFQFFR